jgi:diguanylate cyclase (GGDEF)-like protein
MDILETASQPSGDFRLKQVEHLYAHTVWAPVINIIIAAVLSVLLWSVTPHPHILGWVLALLVLNAARIGLGWLYQRDRHSPEESSHWIRFYVVAAVLSGAAWGSAALLMPTDRIEYQALVILMVGGMVIGSLSTLAMSKAAFSIYLFAAVVPISVRMFAIGGFIPTLIGGLTLVFMLTMYAIGRQIFGIFTSAFVSRINAEKMARRDPLTNIANRRLLDEYLEQIWYYAVRGTFPLSLVLIDIDNFKQYNDHYGHTQGDECLKRVADVLRCSLPRRTDLMARYGGEEFVALLPFTDADGGALVAERLRSAVSQLEIGHAPAVATPQVTVSLGGATCAAKPDGTPTELVNLADQAMYEAKAAGKNRCVWKTVGDKRTGTGRTDGE